MPTLKRWIIYLTMDYFGSFNSEPRIGLRIRISRETCFVDICMLFSQQNHVVAWTTTEVSTRSVDLLHFFSSQKRKAKRSTALYIKVVCHFPKILSSLQPLFFCKTWWLTFDQFLWIVVPCGAEKNLFVEVRAFTFSSSLIFHQNSCFCGILN